MKKQIINTIKFISLYIIFVLAIILPTFIIPVSTEIQARISADMQSKLFLLMLFVSLLGTVSLVVVVNFSNWSKLKLFLGLSFSFFGIEYFMAQIETLYFIEAFSFMPIIEIFYILIRGLITTFIVVAASILFFGRDKNSVKNKFKYNITNINKIKWLKKSLIFAVLYIIFYLIFGYFIAWQYEEVRIFYTGITENISFFEQVLYNIKNMNFFLPYHFLRGILWVIFSIPIILMMAGNKKKTIISLLLLFAYHGLQIIMAQGFFPPEVIVAHTIETTISASIYGILIGYLFYIPVKNE
ncbi:MAG TPA: hypothetical protein VJ907_05675 [Halanaerobiales bacterium]|nr:hypothetical protein [Halanaerobiales bacterium]